MRLILASLYMGAMMGWSLSFASNGIRSDKAIESAHLARLEATPDISSQFPKLHENFSIKLTKMAKQARKLYGANYELIPRLFITDDPGFFTATTSHQVVDSTSAMYRYYANIYISTGTLDQFLKHKELSEPQKEALVTMVLAHELGHAIEYVDPQGATDLATRLSADFELSEGFAQTLQGSLQQYREVRADTDAALIARAAGYDPSYLHVALNEFSDYEARDVEKDIFNTHPPKETRTTFLEIVLSLIRQNHGQVSLDESFRFPKEEIEKLRWHLERHKKTSKANSYFSKKLSLDQALLEVMKIGRDDQGVVRMEDLAYAAEIHIRLVYINRLLAYGKKITSADYDKYLSTLFMLTNNNEKIRLLNEREVGKAFGSVIYNSRFLLNQGTYYRFLKTLPEKHLSQIKNAIRRKKSSQAFSSYLYALSPELLEKLDQNLLKKLVEIRAKHNGDSLDIISKTDPSGRSSVQTISLLMSEKVLQSNRQLLTYLTLLNDQAGGNASMRFVPVLDVPESTTSNSARLALIARYKSTTQNDPEGLRMKNQLKRMWQMRSSLALFDLLSRKVKIDWSFIFEVLEIDTKSGYQSLRESIASLASSPKDFVKALNDVGAASGSVDRKGWRVEKEKLNSNLEWFDLSLIPLLSGQSLTEKDKSSLTPEAHKVLNELQSTLIMMSPPSSIDQRYSLLLRKYFQEGKPKTTEALLKIQVDVMRELDLWRKSSSGPGFDHRSYEHGSLTTERWDPRFAHLFLETLLDSNLGDNKGLLKQFWQDLDQSTQLADQLIKVAKYDTASRFSMYWIDYTSVEKTLKTAALLEKIGVLSLEDPMSILEKHRQHATFAAHTVLVGILKDSIREKLKKTRLTKDYLLQLAEYLFGLQNANEHAARLARKSLSSGVDQVRSDIWNHFLGLNPNVDEVQKMFKAMTTLAPSKITDKIMAHLHRMAIDEKDPHEKKSIFAHLESFLSQGRVFDPGLNTEIARSLLEDEVLALSKVRTHDRMDRFYNRLNQVIPGKSGARDQYLDELSWRLQLSQEEERAFPELMLVKGWRNTPPWLVNMLSSMHGLAKKLSKNETQEFLDYLLYKSSAPPVWFSEKLGVVADEVMENKLADGAIQGLATQFGGIGRATNEVLIMNLRNTIEKLAPEQRALLVSTFLKTNQHDPMKIAPQLIERYLGYKKGSVEEIYMTSFLKVLPSHERTLGLSYILSQNASDNSGSSSADFGRIAEVFRAPGVKLAQLAAIWRIFNEEISLSLAKAKDKTSGLDRASLQKVIDNEMDGESKSKITLKKRLASASLKTTLLADMRLDDGTLSEVVVAVLDPDAEAQIKENLDLMQRYMEELQDRGVSVESRFFLDLVHDFRALLFQEADLRNEAARIAEAAEAYKKISQDMKSEMNGWSFEVPEVIPNMTNSKRVLVMKFAKGAVPFDQLNAANKKSVGSYFFKSQMQMIFRHKIINPDFHTGNLLVSPETKVIYPIDWGQSEKIKDERLNDFYQTIKLLNAISGGRGAVKEILRLAPELVRKGVIVDQKALSDLKSRLEMAFSSNLSTGELVQKTVMAFSDSGLPLNDFITLKIIKGLLILQGENYVPPKEFEELFAAEARGYILREHAWDFASDKVSSWLGLKKEAPKPQFKSCEQALLGK